MKFIHDTISLCNHCYRHIPGVVFERNDQIWLSKMCHEHGQQQEIVELDPEYYYGIVKNARGNLFHVCLRPLISANSNVLIAIKCPTINQ